MDAGADRAWQKPGVLSIDPAATGDRYSAGFPVAIDPLEHVGAAMAGTRLWRAGPQFSVPAGSGADGRTAQIGRAARAHRAAVFDTGYYLRRQLWRAGD